MIDKSEMARRFDEMVVSNLQKDREIVEQYHRLQAIRQTIADWLALPDRSLPWSAYKSFNHIWRLWTGGTVLQSEKGDWLQHEDGVVTLRFDDKNAVAAYLNDLMEMDRGKSSHNEWRELNEP